MSLTFGSKKIGMNAIMGTRYINPKKLRTDLGLSRRQVGERINVSQSTVAGWENRRRIPNVIDIWKLAGALGIVQQNIGKLVAYWALVDD
jgi:transcriptional regulator with XRE-family HTH domain|tara:strand:- start:5647 stop:5916 length:270 start_codon:yes stop_codon:yes gene_type:complete